jgi:uncharacterized protein (DUF488 family)
VHGVRTLVDIRALPMSRRMPYISCESLKWSCLNRRIAYVWMKALGGRRRKILSNSPNVARNYADYVLTATSLRQSKVCSNRIKKTYRIG